LAAATAFFLVGSLIPAAPALSPKITTWNDAELATNAAENFDADRPRQNYKQRLPAGREPGFHNRRTFGDLL
jgi:hypothetical protein